MKNGAILRISRPRQAGQAQQAAMPENDAEIIVKLLHFSLST